MIKNVWNGRIQTAMILTAALAGVSAGSTSAQEIIFKGEKAPVSVYETYKEPLEGEEPAEGEETAEREEPAEGEEAAGGEKSAQMTLDVESLHVLGTVQEGEETQSFAAVLIPNTLTDEKAPAEEAETEIPEEASENKNPEAEVETEAGSEEAPWITGFVMTQDLMELIPALSLDDLPSVEGWETRSEETVKENVKTAQECLIDLDILDDVADGAIGPNTSAALQTFRQKNGLPAADGLDLLTFLCLQERAADRDPMEVTYPPVFTVEEKFSNILDDVEDSSVLEAFTTPDWKYTYDVYEGEGTITQGKTIAFYEDSSRPVDAVSISLEPAVQVKRTETGSVGIEPVLRVHSVGNYRPYVKKVILRAGNAVYESEEAALSGALSGTQVEEWADVPVSADDIQTALQKGAGDNSFEIRLVGNSRNYDMTVDVTLEEMVNLLEKMR